MGRRKKSSKKAVKKKRATVAKVFKCPFCAHDESVECKMDRDRSIGYLTCRICGAGYQMTINYLSEPIDIYSEWIDECEAETNQVLGDG